MKLVHLSIHLFEIDDRPHDHDTICYETNIVYDKQIEWNINSEIESTALEYTTFL